MVYAKCCLAADKLVDSVDCRCKLRKEETDLGSIDEELKLMSHTVYKIAESVSERLSPAESGED